MARLLLNKAGATAIEYALIAGFIALVIVGVIGVIGTSTNNSLGAANAGFERS